jgi:ABC-type multidrug transport system fused ATPase/permease subunit
LRHALAKETVDKTVLIVAQRISTIMQADNIIVLDNGKIVGQGRHAELLKNSKIYQEIAQSQLSEKELKASVDTLKATDSGVVI